MPVPVLSLRRLVPLIKNMLQHRRNIFRTVVFCLGIDIFSRVLNGSELWQKERPSTFSMNGRIGMYSVLQGTFTRFFLLYVPHAVFVIPLLLQRENQP